MFILAVLLVLIGSAFAGLPSRNPSKLFPDGRIVGGSNTNIALHPWQVSLQHRQQHFCGGFLISSTWVITTAQCITDRYSTDLSIRAGSTNRSSGGQTAFVSKIVLHTAWSDVGYDHDIAALQLDSEIIHANTRAAMLPSPGDAVPEGATVTVTGWGQLIEDGSETDTLQAVSMPAVSRADCIAAYGSIPVTTNMFCAGNLGIGGADSCQGDSGGPASVDGVVVGIVSWGFGCGRPEFPGVYAKISSLRSWITEATGILGTGRYR